MYTQWQNIFILSRSGIWINLGGHSYNTEKEETLQDSVKPDKNLK